MKEHENIIIYKDKNGNNNIEVKMQDNTVWLNQEQLVKLYNSSKSNISEHIKHIFEEGELEENSVVRNFRTTASDGKNYNAHYYNLDMIVSIGFRVRSNIGTNFRRWANERLTEYMTKGFTMNDDLLLLIMTQEQKSHKSFLKQFKIKCTGLHMVTQLLKLS